MKLTYEDFLKIPYDGKRHEIIDGVHYVSDGHYTRSQRVMFRLKTMLHQRGDFFFRNFAGHTAVMGTENADGNREFSSRSSQTSPITSMRTPVSPSATRQASWSGG